MKTLGNDKVFWRVQGVYRNAILGTSGLKRFEIFRDENININLNQFTFPTFHADTSYNIWRQTSYF